MNPRIAERPSRGIDIRVGVGAAVQKQLGDVQVSRSRCVPQWHSPAWSRLFQLFQYHALIYISSQIEQQSNRLNLPVFYSNAEESTIGTYLPQQPRICVNEFPDAGQIPHSNRGANRQVSATLQ